MIDVPEFLYVVVFLYIYRDLLLYGANNPIPYLERCYDDWKKRIHDMKILYKNEIES